MCFESEAFGGLSSFFQPPPCCAEIDLVGKHKSTAPGKMPTVDGAMRGGMQHVFAQ
jgi:hypothetical protein